MRAQRFSVLAQLDNLLLLTIVAHAKRPRGTGQQVAYWVSIFVGISSSSYAVLSSVTSGLAASNCMRDSDRFRLIMDSTIGSQAATVLCDR